MTSSSSDSFSVSEADSDSDVSTDDDWDSVLIGILIISGSCYGDAPMLWLLKGGNLPFRRHDVDMEDI